MKFISEWKHNLYWKEKVRTAEYSSGCYRKWYSVLCYHVLVPISQYYQVNSISIQYITEDRTAETEERNWTEKNKNHKIKKYLKIPSAALTKLLSVTVSESAFYTNPKPSQDTEVVYLSLLTYHCRFLWFKTPHC